MEFLNENGAFKEGDEVWFNVENRWSGGWMLGTSGVLRIVADEWVIQVPTGHFVTINKGYDAYGGSIRHPVKSVDEQIAAAHNRYGWSYATPSGSLPKDGE
jgi:hypothetical protein